jgi:DNA-directed RNA polymerase specialized sigma subunit, sigma24 homolog
MSVRGEEEARAGGAAGVIWRWLDATPDRDPHLMNVLRSLARPLGLTPEEREEAARELLTMAATTALEKERCGEYDPAKAPPKHFVLGIARNIALRKGSERFRNRSADTFSPDGEDGAATDLWERWTPLRPGFEERVLDRAWIDGLMAQLSEEDQRTIRHGLFEGLTGDELATALGVSPGAARTRLSRALKRLARLAREDQNLDPAAAAQQTGLPKGAERSARQGWDYGRSR